MFGSASPNINASDDEVVETPFLIHEVVKLYSSCRGCVAFLSFLCSHMVFFKVLLVLSSKLI